MPWHYGWYPDAYSLLLFKVPDRQLTLLLLVCTDRASSVFCLGNGDALRSAFVSVFLNGIPRRDKSECETSGSMVEGMTAKGQRRAIAVRPGA